MELTNKEIINYTENLVNAFKEETKYFPAKVNYLISKNKKTLMNYYEDINRIRLETIKKYGDLQPGEDSVYSFKEEYVKTVNKELDDLLNIKQDIEIYKINFNDLNDIEFTNAQMDALLFMIENEEDDD